MRLIFISNWFLDPKPVLVKHLDELLGIFGIMRKLNALIGVHYKRQCRVHFFCFHYICRFSFNDALHWLTSLPYNWVSILVAVIVRILFFDFFKLQRLYLTFVGSPSLSVSCKSIDAGGIDLLAIVDKLSFIQMPEYRCESTFDVVGWVAHIMNDHVKKHFLFLDLRLKSFYFKFHEFMLTPTSHHLHSSTKSNLSFVTTLMSFESWSEIRCDSVFYSAATLWSCTFWFFNSLLSTFNLVERISFALLELDCSQWRVSTSHHSHREVTLTILHWNWNWNATFKIVWNPHFKGIWLLLRFEKDFRNCFNCFVDSKSLLLWKSKDWFFLNNLDRPNAVVESHAHIH